MRTFCSLERRLLAVPPLQYLSPVVVPLYPERFTRRDAAWFVRSDAESGGLAIAFT